MKYNKNILKDPNLLLLPGHLGCTVDVIALLDTACSGKRECVYEVHNKELQATKPCPAGVASYLAYLEVIYNCIKGT